MGRRTAKDAPAAFGGAAKDVTALGGEDQSLVPTSNDSMHDGALSLYKSRFVQYIIIRMVGKISFISLYFFWLLRLRRWSPQKPLLIPSWECFLCELSSLTYTLSCLYCVRRPLL